LILDNNKLTGKHMPELSQAIWSNASLRKLSLSGCFLFDNGCHYLLDGLERNVTL